MRELPYGAITRWCRLVRFVLERSAHVLRLVANDAVGTAKREARALVDDALLSIHNRYDKDR